MRLLSESELPAAPLPKDCAKELPSLQIAPELYVGWKRFYFHIVENKSKLIRHHMDKHKLPQDLEYHHELYTKMILCFTQ